MLKAELGKPKKRKKKSPTELAKEKAWKEFSIFIRTRDCLRTTFNKDEGTCVTCGRLYPFKQLQAGHFIPGRNNSVLFQERGVHAQCPGCNLIPPRGKGGNPIKYWLFMEEYYGREIIDELIAESNETRKYTLLDYQQISQQYREKTEALLNGTLAPVLQTTF